MVKRALISVSDKSGIVEFARSLKDLGVEILSTGGTARKLKDSGVDVRDVSDYTGFPEILDGRVKTLHPKIHAGILALRDKEDHMKTLQELGIDLIDMVVVNLYPFEETISKKGVTFEEAIENIDIGGPTILRAAAKNFMNVIVIVDPDDYDRVLEELHHKGEISLESRLRLAQKVFERTSRYDRAIADYLNSKIS